MMISFERRLWGAATLLAVLGLVAAGCGGNDSSAASTTSRPSTTARSSTTESPASPACAKITIPAGATGQTTASADVDGDGKADELRTFVVGESNWHLQAALAAGGGADLKLTTFDPGAVAVLGGVDLDDDGADEIWARTGSGASATILGLVHYADCALTRVTFAGGDPVELAVGGSVGTASGVECATDRDAAIIAYTASNTGENEYQVTATTFALEGTVLVQKGSTSSTVTTNDALFERATGFTCGELHL